MSYWVRVMLGVALCVVAWGLMGATTDTGGVREKVSHEMRWQPAQAAHGIPVQLNERHSWRASASTAGHHAVLRYYLVRAKKGQRLSVHYATNITGQGFVVCRVDQHGNMVGGLMTRHGLQYGVTDWSGRIPATGTYVVRVNLARGGDNRGSHVDISLR